MINVELPALVGRDVDVLDVIDACGTATAREVADLLEFTRTRAAQILSRLERNGWVERVPYVRGGHRGLPFRRRAE